MQQATLLNVFILNPFFFKLSPLQLVLGKPHKKKGSLVKWIPTHRIPLTTSATAIIPKTTQPPSDSKRRVPQKKISIEYTCIS